MKCLTIVVDNDWFVFLSMQLGIDEMNFLPKAPHQYDSV